MAASPPKEPAPPHLVSARRGSLKLEPEPEPEPPALKLEPEPAPQPQQLRRRPSPVRMPAGAKQLADYRHGSKSLSNFGAGGSPPADGSSPAEGESPRSDTGSTSSKSPRKRSRKKGGRRNVKPLDLATARKIDSLGNASEGSTELSPLEKAATVAAPQRGGLELSRGAEQPRPALATSRWPMLRYIAGECGARPSAEPADPRQQRQKARIAQRLRVHNTLNVPFSLERLLMWGTVLCMDSFLFLFTLFPLRFARAAPRAAVRVVPGLRSLVAPLSSAQCVDVARGLILLLACTALFYVDIARNYHVIRGQAIIKLYVIYNVLEICDKMCCYVGPDVLDALYWSVSYLSAPVSGGGGHATTTWAGLLKDFTISLVYVYLHALVLIFQVVTLQVAMHSSNNALLTLLVSNNFVELKGSIFKKFECSHLFQITAADMSERFQLVLVLFIMLCQQLSRTNSTMSTEEVHTSVWASLGAVIKSAADVLTGETGANTAPGENVVEYSTSLPHVMVVLWVCEMFVDWIKHAFIVKFNDIPHCTYTDLAHILAADVLTAHKRQPHLDQEHAITYRLSFSTLPRAALALRMLGPLLLRAEEERGVLTLISAFAVYACLLSLKILISIYIRAHAYWKLCEAPEHDGADDS